jgi:polysaccharide pyruvyl transferase WcaK-like protein
MSVVEYIGWTGHGNLGDDAGLAALHRLCPTVRFSTEPTGEGGVCVLGGGTLIHGTDFLKRAQNALARGARLYVFGAGVNLSAAWQQWPPTLREQWSDVLRAATRVGVRGPMSLAFLDKLGISRAYVLGDPALSLGKRALGHSQVVTLNGGCDGLPVSRASAADGGWWFVYRCLQAVARLACQEGWQLAYLPMRANDDLIGDSVQSHFPMAKSAIDVQSAMALASTSRLVVALRLHAAVFAAACGVPAVLLAYSAKHADFARSVGLTGYCLSTNELTAEQLVQAVCNLEKERVQISERIWNAVCAYRERQRGLAAEIVDAAGK